MLNATKIILPITFTYMHVNIKYLSRIKVRSRLRPNKMESNVLLENSFHDLPATSFMYFNKYL